MKVIMLNKINQLSDNLKSSLGLVSLTIVIFFTFFVLNIFYGPDKNEPVIQITKEGHELIEQYKNAAREIAEVYDCYESCSIAPPALGIPGGFDVRVQMMELDGKNLSESILLRVLEDFGEEFFSGDWAQTFENMSFYNNVLDGLAFKTNFSFEISL